MIIRSLPFLSLTLILCRAVAAFAEDCAPEFAHLPRAEHVLTESELNLIKEACSWGRAGRLDTQIPEIALYLAYECQGKTSFPVFREFLSKGLKRERVDASQREGADWKTIAPIKLKFAGVPEDDVARWKATALYDLAASRSAVADYNFNQDNIRNFILDLKLAQPFLEESELQEGLRFAASKMARQYASQYQGLFEPKLFQFYKESIRRDLGLSYRPLSDVWVYRDKEKIHLWVVTTDPVENPFAKPTLAEGLQWMYANVVNVPAEAKKGQALSLVNVEWKHAGRNYKAEISVVAGDEPKNFVRPLPSLDYDQLWADKKLNGLILPGTNMGTGEAGAHEVMNEYRAFYESKGFRFGRPKQIPDLEQHLKEELSSGRLDFLVKEAHADGNDASLVKFSRNGELITGTKKLAGKKEETVQIFFPREEDLAGTKGEPLAYASIADWVKARNEAGGKQLLVVDTSCGGLGAVCRLANTVQDPNLVVVGSANTLDTFTNAPESPLYHVLDGIRKKQTFAEIDAAMQAANTEGEGIYHFPGSAEWSHAISDQAQRAVVVDAKVFENGLEVDVETVGR